MDSQAAKMAIPRPASATARTEETRSAPLYRVLQSVSRVFDSMSPSFASVILWNIMMTQRLGFRDIADKPTQFIEGLHAIYGEPQARAIEAELVKEIQREFGLAQRSQSFPEAVSTALMH